MSVKTLDNVHALVLPATIPQARTYSIAPTPASVPVEAAYASPAEVEAFLQAENPLGCLRGVMWVMAFNMAVFMLGLMIWQSCKLLL